jgi:hypothetical protein
MSIMSKLMTVHSIWRNAELLKKKMAKNLKNSYCFFFEIMAQLLFLTGRYRSQGHNKESGDNLKDVWANFSTLS